MKGSPSARAGHRDPARAEAGARTEEVCRRYGISSATLYKWKSKYGGLKVSEREAAQGAGG